VIDPPGAPDVIDPPGAPDVPDVPDFDGDYQPDADTSDSDTSDSDFEMDTDEETDTDTDTDTDGDEDAMFHTMIIDTPTENAVPVTMHAQTMEMTAASNVILQTYFNM
jgi:hypothetical protein